MRVFVATPIAGFQNDAQMAEYRKSLLPFFNLIKQYHDVYAEIIRVKSAIDYDSPECSAKLDFQLIKECDVFVLHFPKKICTSALIELGYAIALNKKVIIVVDRLETLPFIGQGLPGVCSNVSTIFYNNLDLSCAQTLLSLISK